MNIPYGKVAIYLLTFVGYIYSGYGSDLLGNLRDAIITGETIFGDVLKNVVKVAQKFGNVRDVVNAAVEEDCVFKCTSGARPKPNRNHVPSSNGCGPLGLKIKLPKAAMEKCCDGHDICYDTCNKDKELCDIEFRRCLYKFCDDYADSLGGETVTKGCKAAAKLLYTGTLTLGCKAYIDSQTKACYCQPVSGKDKKKSKYTSGADKTEF